MLPKKNRANKKMVEAVFKNGRSINSFNISFKFILNRDSQVKNISFVAPKALVRLAVKRNALRRMGYQAIANYLPDFPPGVTGVFVFKKPSPSPLKLIEDIKFILGKI